jgi:hypothetical protein
LILELPYYLSGTIFLGMIPLAVIFNIDYHSDLFLMTWVLSFFSMAVFWYVGEYITRRRGFPPVKITNAFVPDEKTLEMFPQTHGTVDLEFVNEKYMDMFRQANEVEHVWTT